MFYFSQFVEEMDVSFLLFLKSPSTTAISDFGSEADERRKCGARLILIIIIIITNIIIIIINILIIIIINDNIADDEKRQ